MNIHITGIYHRKNDIALREAIKIMNWNLTSFEEANVVFSANVFFDIAKYPTKKFVFGPHFSVFPNDEVRNFNNIHKNAIYIQPSEQAVTPWVDEFKFDNLPVYSYAFGVDTNQFKPVKTLKTEVILYYKNRDPSEFNFLTDFLTKKEITFTPIIYGSYNENVYIDTLKRTKYCIWLGSHESQGFALEEALSMNVPLLVWNVTQYKQEYSYRDFYENVKTRVETIPYWDKRCGEYFYSSNELENVFKKFISNLDSYTPRDFIVETLSMEKRAFALQKLLREKLNI